MERREVLGLLGLLVAGGSGFCEFARAEDKIRLRPPGALDEKEFMSKCIRCGLCVEACPFDTLKLAEFGDSGVPNGTPFFQPRLTPCYMCQDIPCTVACPTSALDKQKVSENDKLNINKAQMGVAVVDQKNCVAYFGIQCDACYRACPVMDKALFIKYKRNTRTEKHAFLLPVVDSDYCTGCGKCEKACITEKAAITVLPRNSVLGKVNDNYVKGWIEGDDAKLKDADSQINLNLKKGIDYLNGGEL
ncbi:ferredoxin-type protein NapG [Campylobacter sp. JMF_07 ED4]|uniref:ferredoxin-type protein NapG n=1 Tax=Campylobacter sp. JMF_07 ED4 TaxID=2983840 RepID=UPI0022E9FD22|nr:ferredoxin-type protein NapG [Campylobacter sp. JMF_07 ED4]MDA3044259.1 ferredoxin-type protein NapG [Campylobacter sp. JMF_07 ED4]